MSRKYDFAGWATKANILCSDGRIISPDAFKGCDGVVVPLVWNHRHNDPQNVLGNAVLEHREDGTYAYCTFNNTPNAKAAREQVEHGDITQLSIYANGLKHQGNSVVHGAIKEVSLVLSGANKGAVIDDVIMHGEYIEDSAVITPGEDYCELELYHSEDGASEGGKEQSTEVSEEVEQKEQTEEPENTEENQNGGQTKMQEVFDSMTEEQKDFVYAVVGQALDQGELAHSELGGETMKQNVFDNSTNETRQPVLSHSDMREIIALAKEPGVGSLQQAFNMWVSNNEEFQNVLAHTDDLNLNGGWEDIGVLFPDFKDVYPGMPEKIKPYNDYSWVDTVLQGVKKSPISRVRTRQVDATSKDLRAKGYKKGNKKTEQGLMKMLMRTTDPQTVYRKDSIHRDDVIDITEYDVVGFKYQEMREDLEEEIATAILIGDGREDIDEDKISEDHIRSILNDDELYTIHYEIDIDGTKKELQGNATGENFGDNYIYAESIIKAALYSREQFKGSGQPIFFCTPHLVNVMLLAKDRNGRPLYSSITELASKLNVSKIVTIEKLEGVKREDERHTEHKLLGIFVNLSDYKVGCTKGGEITKFENFDIDFNRYKYLIETRLSGALTRIKSAIVIEEPVTASGITHTEG